MYTRMAFTFDLMTSEQDSSSLRFRFDPLKKLFLPSNESIKIPADLPPVDFRAVCLVLAPPERYMQVAESFQWPMQFWCCTPNSDNIILQDIYTAIKAHVLSGDIVCSYTRNIILCAIETAVIWKLNDCFCDKNI